MLYGLPARRRRRRWAPAYPDHRRSKDRANNEDHLAAHEKGQDEIEVTIPLLPILERTLEAGPAGGLAFICGENGRPLKKESFGNAFSEAARMAGVNKSAHGVCKIAATRAADNCATVHELMAIVGWKTIPMAEVYTREANRRRLALESTHKLVNDARTSIVAPEQQVRPSERKTQ